jgi:hypothetical protein
MSIKFKIIIYNEFRKFEAVRGFGLQVLYFPCKRLNTLNRETVQDSSISKTVTLL